MALPDTTSTNAATPGEEGDLIVRREGSAGFLPIERFWRDLRVHRILEGTNEVMRMIVGRDMLR